MQLGIHIAPALPLAASRRSRTCALRLTPPRCFQGTGTDKVPPRRAAAAACAGATARCFLRSSALLADARRFTAALQQGSKQKLTTEEITSLQPSAAEPGGEMGALDPTAADHLPGATPSGGQLCSLN